MDNEKPGIIYTVIAYNRENLLCDFSEKIGNFQMNSIKILNKVCFNYSASINYSAFKFNYGDFSSNFSL
jgi:hypothetical protein